MCFDILYGVHHSGSDGSMSASGSVGPGVDTWRGKKFYYYVCCVFKEIEVWVAVCVIV